MEFLVLIGYRITDAGGGRKTGQEIYLITTLHIYI